MGGQKSKLMCCSEDYVHNRHPSAEADQVNRQENKNNTNSLIEEHCHQQPAKRKSSYQSDHYQTIEEQQQQEGKEQVRKESLTKPGSLQENCPSSSRVTLTSCDPLHFEFNRQSLNINDKRQTDNLSESKNNHEKNEIAMLNIVNNFLEQKLYAHKNSCSTANTSNISLPDGFLSLPQNAQLKQSQLLNSQQCTATDDALIENIAFINQSTTNSNKTVCQTSSNSSASPYQSPSLFGTKGITLGNPFELELADDNELFVYLRQEASINNNSFKYHSQVAEYTLQNVSSIDEYLSKVEFDIDITDQYSIASKRILFQQSFSKQGIQSQVIHVVFNQGCFKTPRDLLYLKVSQLIDETQFIVAYRSISFSPNVPNEKKNDSTENFANRVRINSSNIYRHSGNGQNGSQVAGTPKIQGKRQSSQQKPTEEKNKRALLGLSGKRVVFDPQNKTLKIQEHLTLDMRSQSSHYVQKQLSIHAVRKRLDKIKAAMKRQTEGQGAPAIPVENQGNQTEQE